MSEKRETIKDILIRRDGMTEEDAQELIDAAREELREAVDNGDIWRADDICAEYFGLEPDYLDELLPDLF